MQAVAAVLLMAVRKEMVLAAGVMVVQVLITLVLRELLTQAAVAVVGQTQPPNKVTDMQVDQGL
jgi:hypothetical protein